MKLILHRSIFFEIFAVFIITLTCFGFIVFVGRIMAIIEWLVNYGVSLLHVLQFILFLLPKIILLSLPAAVLVAVIVTFNRMSSDNEIVAIQSAGISIYQIIPPVILMSFISAISTAFLISYVAPLFNQSFRVLSSKIIMSSVQVGLKERVFFEPFNDVVFYINSLSADSSSMKDVFIVDKREERVMTNTIVARKGELMAHEGREIFVVSLKDGVIFITERDKDSVRSIRFRSYDLTVDLKDMIPSVEEAERETSDLFLGELVDRLRGAERRGEAYRMYMFELTHRFALPFAVFFMGLVGAPLGAQVKARGRFSGGVFGLIVFLLYYICFAASRNMTEAGVLPPQIGPWIPGALVAAAWVFFMRRASRGKPLPFFQG